jgi:hypothetical protein
MASTSREDGSMWRMRVRPGRAPSVLTAVVGVAMLLFFVLFFLPGMGSVASGTPMAGTFSGFGLLFVIVLLAMIGFAVYNVMNPRGASVLDVDLEHEGRSPSSWLPGRIDPTADVPQAGADGPPSGPDAPPAPDFDARLRKLQGLRDDGLITAEEYEQKRGEILAERW